MGEVQKYSLVEKLREADDSLTGSPSLLGMSGLTYPNYINAMRSTMFTSHLKQFLNLEKVEFPFVFTNNENIVGKHNTAFKTAEADLEVVRKIVKYGDILDKPKIYKLFTYDKKKDEYNVVERTVCESLTENFGFDYVNDVIDSYEEGDKIKKGTVLFHSTSYDEDMNYGYGQNITVAYTLDLYTSEDAAVASRSLSKAMTSIETDTIPIGLNANDYLVNKYGTVEDYKPLPDIGEFTSDELCRSRRLFKNQILYDFKDENLMKAFDSDQVYYCDKDEEVIDYIIYDNRDEIEENPFYDQINKYYRSQLKYWEEIYDACKEIMDSGSNYTQNIDYTFKQAKEMTNRESKWHDGDNEFGNLKIYAVLRRLAPLAKGSKLTGRSGNKSVVSEIWEDEDMPMTADGRRVDLILNLLAIINRTTAFPCYEMLINGSSYKIRQKMKELPKLEDKEDLLFKFIRIFNEEQEEKMHKYYRKLDKKGKEDYINDAIDFGIHIHWAPMWETIPIFYRCQNLFETFDFIKEDDLYIKKWGRKIKCLNKFFIGEQYIMKLKQTDRRGFIARSTGALDSKSLPTRSFKKKSHLERISTTCIRFGEQETFNFSIGVPTIDIALFHAFYRTSLKGRKDIVALMFDDDEDKIQKIDSSYTSRVAEIFSVILKSMGIAIEFIDDDEEVGVYDDTALTSHEYKGKTLFCTDYQFFLLERIQDIKKKIMDINPIMTETEIVHLIEQEMKSGKYLNGPTPEEVDDIDIKRFLYI